VLEVGLAVELAVLEVGLAVELAVELAAGLVAVLVDGVEQLAQAVAPVPVVILICEINLAVLALL
jgi:hypothetical protein